MDQRTVQRIECEPPEQFMEDNPFITPPDERPNPNEICEGTETLCGALHFAAHKCGELANHEATDIPHRCCLPGDPSDGLFGEQAENKPTEMPVCNFEWEDAETKELANA